MDVREAEIKELKKEYSRIYIFGAGKICQKILKYFFRENKNGNDYFDGIIVSDMENNPQDIMGIKVKPIGKIHLRAEDLVIIGIKKEEEAVSLIREYSDDTNIISYKSIIPDTDFYAYGAAMDKQLKNLYSETDGNCSLFKYVEIETINRCNGECEFCPVNKNRVQRPYARMSESLFKKIILELEAIKYNGLLALFSNNEPFLDSRIIEFVKYASEKLVDAQIYLYTNGTVLTLEKFKSIIEYLDFIQVDNYTPENGKLEEIIKIEGYVKEKNLWHKYNYVETPKSKIRFSRGGEAPNFTPRYTLECACNLPFVQMVIRPTGEVSLCCNDALGKITLGDVNRESLQEIWNGEKYKEIRRKILKGRNEIDLCRRCNTVDRKPLDVQGSIGHSVRTYSEEKLFPRGFLENDKIYIVGENVHSVNFYNYIDSLGEATVNIRKIDEINDILEDKNVGIYINATEYASYIKDLNWLFNEYNMKDVRLFFE